MKIDRSLLSGSSAMLVLGLLSEGDMYGYQITEQLSARSENVFEMKSGTLYPLLHNLEQKGFVTAYERTEGGRERRYYAITDAGREKLAQDCAAWLESKKELEKLKKQAAEAGERMTVSPATAASFASFTAPANEGFFMIFKPLAMCF